MTRFSFDPATTAAAAFAAGILLIALIGSAQLAASLAGLPWQIPS